MQVCAPRAIGNTACLQLGAMLSECEGCAIAGARAIPRVVKLEKPRPAALSDRLDRLVREAAICDI
eukprot:1268400-Pleurochrysis_carterae.AAC.5